MKPVRLGQVNQLVGRWATTLVNKTNLGVSFVDAAVCCSPSCITSKQGHKQLPTEVWLMIIDLATQDDNRCTYTLAIPFSMKMHSQNGWTLLCTELETNDVFLQSHASGQASLHKYERRLNRPYGMDDNKFPRKIRISTAFRLRAKNIKIPATTLLTRLPVIFAAISVRDIIWRIKRGGCLFCHNSRRLRAPGRDDTFICVMPCPVCCESLCMQEWFRQIPRHQAKSLIEGETEISRQQFFQWRNERDLEYLQAD